MKPLITIRAYGAKILRRVLAALRFVDDVPHRQSDRAAA